jgi:hypothetical protein
VEIIEGFSPTICPSMRRAGCKSPAISVIGDNDRITRCDVTPTKKTEVDDKENLVKSGET